MADTRTESKTTVVQRSSNFVVAFMFVGVIGIMLGYVPPALLSVLLAVNISIALMVLMISLYMREPLEFSTFPTVLLLLTFFRLALNVASTKLILTPSTDIQNKAGAVIEFFGRVVAGDNAVIGFVVFMILVIIQFVVITKGSGRIAEVAARFTLDAMPGKQMAIDADLNAGLINEAEARQRREEISREADFYGAMDGASKFVRGDATAGLIITAINIVGGIAVGFMEGMDFFTVLRTYTLLTIGDGLGSQIPALLTSTAAGIVVTRASEERALGESLFQQFFSRPEAMFVAASALFVVAGLGMLFGPGIVLPFSVFATALGLGAWQVQRTQKIQKAEEEEKARIEEEEAPPEPEKVESLLEVDPMEIEIGFGLIPIVDSEQGGDLLDRVSVIRKQTAVELGIIVPPIRIRDNMQLGQRQYNILIRGVKVADGEIRPDRLLAMKPTAEEEDDDVPGIKTTEPAFGTPAKWIEPDERSRAEMAGYSVVEPASVLATHLTEVIRNHAHDLLGRQEVQQLIDHLKERNQVLVNELLQVANVKIGVIQKVLQNLLRERIPIRNLELIFEAIADYAEAAQMNHETITEYCRMNLARIITNLYVDKDGRLPVITIDPNIENRVMEGIQRGGMAGIMATDPIYAEQVIASVEREVSAAISSGYHPLILTSPQIRSHVRRLCERRIPYVIVLSYNEVAPEVPVSRITTVRLQSASEKVPS
ncbi:MAG: flagellar biosynthesis protein FlhA [Candidatus Omnitrophota bacterium]|jgi:flagellar biosynthesis protein FlhA|nr:MAG: flagellar biosynthesis protein FlhA [Candidatus Omnitrophota bacterium]